MYRFVYLVMLNLVSHSMGYHQYRQPWRYNDRQHRYQQYDQLDHDQLYNNEEINHFTRVLGYYTAADASFEKYCYDHSTVEPLIIYEHEKCVVKYTVPMTAIFNIDVRIKNKMLRTLVIMDTYDPDFDSFVDVRVLPDILDFEKAFWTISNGEFNITMPYKVPLGTGYTPQCDYVDNGIIFVQYAPPEPETPKFQYR